MNFHFHFHKGYMIYKPIVIPLRVVIWQLGYWWYTLWSTTLPPSIILNPLNLTLLCHPFATLLKACLLTSSLISSIQNSGKRGLEYSPYIVVDMLFQFVFIWNRVETYEIINFRNMFSNQFCITIGSLFPYFITLTNTVVIVIC